MQLHDPADAILYCKGPRRFTKQVGSKGCDDTNLGGLPKIPLEIEMVSFRFILKSHYQSCSSRCGVHGAGLQEDDDMGENGEEGMEEVRWHFFWCIDIVLGGGFKCFNIFTPIWGNDPI